MKQVTILKSFATPKQYYKPGTVVEMEDALADHLYAKGKVEIVGEKPVKVGKPRKPKAKPIEVPTEPQGE